MKPKVIVKLNKYDPDKYVYPFEVVVRIIEQGDITTFNEFFKTEKEAKDFIKSLLE